MSPDYSQAVKDIIDGLGDSPTPDEIYHAVRNYSVDNVVAAAASAAKAGGGPGGGSQPAGSDGEIQFNDNGAFGASPDLAWDNAGKKLLLNADENGTAEIVANALGAQLQLTAAAGDATHVGGEVVITAGTSDGSDGGTVSISGGDDTGGATGGNVNIASGSSDEWDGGDIAILANPHGPAGHRGGDINVIAGTGTSFGGNLLLQGGAASGNVQVYSGDGSQALQLDNSGLNVIANVGFYGAAPIAQQTGVAVSVAAIHAALVALGLITA